MVILRDDGYGMIRWKQATMGFAHLGLDYGNPDFVKSAWGLDATPRLGLLSPEIYQPVNGSKGRKNAPNRSGRLCVICVA